MEAISTSLAALFAAANTLTPLALVGLVIGVLYIQIYRQPSMQDLHVLKTNDLHELPEVASNMRRAVDTLQRIETTMSSNFATVIAKLEDKN